MKSLVVEGKDMLWKPPFLLEDVWRGLDGSCCWVRFLSGQTWSLYVRDDLIVVVVVAAVWKY